MDTTTWLILAGFAVLCIAVRAYLRRKPGQKPRGDDWGGEL